MSSPTLCDHSQESLSLSLLTPFFTPWPPLSFHDLTAIFCPNLSPCPYLPHCLRPLPLHPCAPSASPLCTPWSTFFPGTVVPCLPCSWLSSPMTCAYGERLRTWEQGKRACWGKAEEQSESSSRGNHRAYGGRRGCCHGNLWLWGKGKRSHSLRRVETHPKEEPLLPSCFSQQLHSYNPSAIY